MTYDQQEKFFRDAVWNGGLTAAEVQSIKDSRARGWGKVTFVAIDKGATELTLERREELAHAIQRKNGASEVVFLPPGYTIVE